MAFPYVSYIVDALFPGLQCLWSSDRCRQRQLSSCKSSKDELVLHLEILLNELSVYRELTGIQTAQEAEKEVEVQSMETRFGHDKQTSHIQPSYLGEGDNVKSLALGLHNQSPLTGIRLVRICRIPSCSSSCEATLLRYVVDTDVKETVFDSERTPSLLETWFLCPRLLLIAILTPLRE